MTEVPPAAKAGALALGVLAVSSSAVLIRLADAPALTIAFWRCIGGSVALLPFALRARRALPSLDRTQRWQLIASGLLLAVHFALFITSVSFTTVASAVLFATFSPLFVAVGATRFLGEPPSRRTWIGLGISLVGAVVVAVGDIGDVRLGTRALLGDALELASAVAVTGYLLLGRAARQRLPNTVYASSVYGVAAMVLLPASFVGGGRPVGHAGTTWLVLLAIVVGPQLLGHTVFNWLLSSLTATVVAVTVLAEPVGATVLAWLALDELPSGAFYVGAPLILAGVFVAANVRARDETEEAAATPP